MALACEVSPRDNTPIPKTVFDARLFANHSTRLRYCLAEAQKSFTQLQNAVQDNRTHQVAYLSERFVRQIGILKQELTIRHISPHT